MSSSISYIAEIIKIINDEYPVKERDPGGCEGHHSCEPRQRTNVYI